MTVPLNPALYNRLQAEFGRIMIAHEGCAASVTHDPVIGGNGFVRTNFIATGEYYRVNCPHCGDSRGRLWINHRWGVQDEVTRSRNLWLAICYNEDCFSQPGRSAELYERLFSLKNANLRGQPGVVLPGTVEDQSLTEVTLPGLVIRLDKLAPTDTVCTYLRSRGLDPVELGQTYGISYCLNASSNYPMAQGRIVIPIIMDDMLVGWQCRYIGDVDFKTSRIPKYYSRPQMPKRLMLYNYDNAKKSPYVVVCEGPSDVWNVGPQSVAIFGKRPSTQQVKLIGQTWKDGVIIVLLDGDAWEDSLRVVDMLKEHVAQTQRLIPIQLPPDKDPGDLSCEFLWEHIDNELRRRGVDLLTLERTNGNNDKHGANYRGYPRRLDDFRRDLAAERGISSDTFDLPRNAATRP